MMDYPCWLHIGKTTLTTLFMFSENFFSPRNSAEKVFSSGIQLIIIFRCFSLSAINCVVSVTCLELVTFYLRPEFRSSAKKNFFRFIECFGTFGTREKRKIKTFNSFNCSISGEVDSFLYRFMHATINLFRWSIEPTLALHEVKHVAQVSPVSLSCFS